MRSVQSLLLGLALVIVATPALAAKVTFSWDPNSETNLAGYKLYYGEQPGVYDGNFGDYGPSPVEIPIDSLEDSQDPEFSLTGLPSCIHLHFVLTAYDDNGNESDFSDAVDATVITKPSVVDFDVRSGGQSIILKWADLEELDENDDGQIVGYRIQYGSTTGDPYDGDFADQGESPLSIDPDQTSFELSGLPTGSSVFVTVEAVCDDGTTSRSEEKSSSIIGFDGSGSLGGGCAVTPAAGQSWGIIGVLMMFLLVGRGQRHRQR